MHLLESVEFLNVGLFYRVCCVLFIFIPTPVPFFFLFTL